MELPHCLLEVGVELSHASREEGVYHTLREVATQVCLEECDQLGFVRLPWQRFTEAPAWMVKSSHKTWLWRTQWMFHVGSIGTDGAILIFLHQHQVHKVPGRNQLHGSRGGGGSAHTQHVRDALDNFKTGHIVIPLLPEASSNWLYAIPHFFWCPTQNAFSSVQMPWKLLRWPPGN